MPHSVRPFLCAKILALALGFLMHADWQPGQPFLLPPFWHPLLYRPAQQWSMPGCLTQTCTARIDASGNLGLSNKLEIRIQRIHSKGHLTALIVDVVLRTHGRFFVTNSSKLSNSTLTCMTAEVIVFILPLTQSPNILIA